MRKMGEGGLKIMGDFGTFGNFQGTDSGRTLDAFWQHLTFDLEGRDCGRRIQR